MVHDALVDYGESQMMAFGGCAVAGKRRDPFNCTGLCEYVALRERATHASAQSSVYASFGQCRMQMQIDIIVVESVAQQPYFKFG